GYQRHFPTLIELAGVRAAQIKTGEEIGAAQFASPAGWDFTGVVVYRMREEFADRHAGLHMEPTAEVQSGEPLAAEYIVDVDLHNVATIGIDWADGELIAKQTEIARSEVEQRTDSRIGLSVVIAEVPFEVAFDLRNSPVGEQLPVLGESLVQFDLHSAI